MPHFAIVVRVMQIIFEVASCPWKDKADAAAHGTEEMTPSFSENIPFQVEDLSLICPDESCKIFVRSMFLRKQYGGMAG